VAEIKLNTKTVCFREHDFLCSTLNEIKNKKDRYLQYQIYIQCVPFSGITLQSRKPNICSM
jgi:hypothetical protein